MHNTCERRLLRRPRELCAKSGEGVKYSCRFLPVGHIFRVRDLVNDTTTLSHSSGEPLAALSPNPVSSDVARVQARLGLGHSSSHRSKAQSTNASASTAELPAPELRQQRRLRSRRPTAVLTTAAAHAPLEGGQALPPDRRRSIQF
eukprot:scaffold46761_cov36-Phaeocystis_antarctica.AAC.1